MGIARVPIPERVPDAVAALDLNHCALRPVAPALASGLEVDPADADRCGLAFFATPPTGSRRGWPPADYRSRFVADQKRGHVRPF